MIRLNVAGRAEILFALASDAELSHMICCLWRDLFTLKVFRFVVGHTCRDLHDRGASRTLSIVTSLQYCLLLAPLHLQDLLSRQVLPLLHLCDLSFAAESFAEKRLSLRGHDSRCEADLVNFVPAFGQGNRVFVLLDDCVAETAFDKFVFHFYLCHELFLHLDIDFVKIACF